MKKILIYTFSLTMALTFAGLLNTATSYARNVIPTPFVSAPKVQIAWIASGAGNNAENYNHASFEDPSLTGRFSYQFENADGTMKGRVEGNNGDISIFAFRTDIAANGTARNVYAQIRYEDGTYYRGATGTTEASEEEAAIFDFAMRFVRHFATLTATGHDHGNHTGHQPPANKDSAERFPIAAGYTAAANPERCIVFVYSRDDLGGGMSAMIFEDTVKFITNLRSGSDI